MGSTSTKRRKIGGESSMSIMSDEVDDEQDENDEDGEYNNNQ